SPNRIHDVLISRATAQIAFDAMADLRVRGIRVAIQNLLRRHNHARCTETALRAMLVPESFLHAVQFAVLRQALDGSEGRAIRLHREHAATLHGLAVE